MEQSPPDYAAATAGFLAGGNDPADVPGLILLFVHARGVSYLADAVEQWRGDRRDPRRLRGGRRGDARGTSKGGLAAASNSTLARIQDLNERMTPRAMAFSKSLGEGSRAIASVIVGANLAVGGVLYALILWRTRLYLRQRRAIARALQAEKERASATLEEIGEAVVRVDRGGRIRYMNPAAQSLAGVGREAIGQPVADVLKLVDVATDAPLADLSGDDGRYFTQASQRTGPGSRNGPHSRHACEHQGYRRGGPNRRRARAA